jgi:hypothetical protein
VLLSEVANFVTFSMRDPKAGADLAKLALRLNPAKKSGAKTWRVRAHNGGAHWFKLKLSCLPGILSRTTPKSTYTHQLWRSACYRCRKRFRAK